MSPPAVRKLYCSVLAFSAAAMVNSEVNKMLVSAMASTATMLRVRAAAMLFRLRRRIQPRLATFIMAPLTV